MNANWGLRDFSAGSQIESAGYGFALRLLWDWFLFNTSALSGPQSHRKKDPHCHKWNTLMAHYLQSQKSSIQLFSHFSGKRQDWVFACSQEDLMSHLEKMSLVYKFHYKYCDFYKRKKYLIIMFCVSAVKSYKCTEQQSWEIKPCLLLPWFFFCLFFSAK